MALFQFLNPPSKDFIISSISFSDNKSFSELSLRIFLRHCMFKCSFVFALATVFTAVKIVYHTPFLSDESLLLVLSKINIFIALGLLYSSDRFVRTGMSRKCVFTCTYSKCLFICFSLLAMLEFLETMNSIGVKNVLAVDKTCI